MLAIVNSNSSGTATLVARHIGGKTLAAAVADSGGGQRWRTADTGRDKVLTGWRPWSETMRDSNSSGGQQQQAAVTGGGNSNTTAEPAATRQQWREWSMSKEGERWWGTTYSKGVVIGGVMRWNICLASGEPYSSRNTNIKQISCYHAPTPSPQAPPNHSIG